MACPDDDELLAMLERSMDPSKFGALEVHIDSCESCRKAVAALALGSRSPSTPATPFAGIDLELTPGSAIYDRYEVRKEIGRGGMGTVYLAHDRTLGRDVALKLHRSGSSADRLQREAIAMAKLAHPNVVGVFEVATVDDRMYVAMEYIRGTTLRGWTAKAQRSWREIVAVLVATGRGLAAAHAAGLVHRDFKPENVLVGDDGRPRVGDFGLARADHAAIVADPALLTTADTLTGGLAGTPAYMAPEQLLGEPVDARCDQFAFCVVAWECLYGKRPFGGPTLAALQLAIEKHELVPGDASVPDRVRAVVERGLATIPADRFADMPALLAAFERAAAPRATRNGLVAAMVLVAVGAGTAAGSTLVASHRHEAACDDAAGAMRARFAGPQQMQITSALLATGSPFARAALDHTVGVLDRVATSLADEAGGVCRDTTLSALARSARAACLEARGSELSAVVQQLAQPGAGLVERAPEAAWTIYDPSPCTDGPPTAPAMSIVFANQLGEIRALGAAEHPREAAAAATKLLAAARAQQDKAAEVAVALALAGLQDEVDPKAAPASYEAAEAAAETQGRDLDAASALGGLAANAGMNQSNFAEAHRELELARAKLARIGGNQGLESKLSMVEAQILEFENRLGEADRAMRTSIALAETLYGKDHPRVGSAYGQLSQIVDGEGKHEEQLVYARKALDVLRSAYGEHNPLVASAIGNLGVALMRTGKLDEARTQLLAADAVDAEIYGADNPAHFSTVSYLGTIGLMASDWKAAHDNFEQARQIVLKREGPTSPALAGADRDDADALEMLGKRDEALARSKEAVGIYEALGDNGAVYLGPALDDLCEHLVAADHYAAALPLAQRALALIEKRPADANPQELADARYMLARTLWETKGDRAHAHELAVAAAETSVEPDHKQHVTDWLAAHHL